MYKRQILDRLIYWVEGKKAGNADVFQPIKAAGQLPQDEQTKMAADLLVAPPTVLPPSLKRYIICANLDGAPGAS